ncbi:hypothetical protein [Bartonella koehlerae]|uniref:Uncharacterized protein n=1 Tax=Bartonella koehlerae C-29 TaxID=1134510 RepID=A0A067WKU0_9HYPH|nr:hypothetical protein [Bartonella koehlerae]KEC56522.1 hypothetical protein O9A_00016 [Bartonella koehlerae C-29]
MDASLSITTLIQAVSILQNRDKMMKEILSLSASFLLLIGLDEVLDKCIALLRDMNKSLIIHRSASLIKKNSYHPGF